MLAREYKAHKQGVNLLIERTREERFDLEDTMCAHAKRFYNDEEHEFGLLMVQTTRTKVHRYVDQLLTQLKHCQTDDAIVQRLRRLIPLYLSQLARYAGASVPAEHAQWYTDMLETVIIASRRVEVLNRLNEVQNKSSHSITGSSSTDVSRMNSGVGRASPIPCRTNGVTLSV